MDTIVLKFGGSSVSDNINLNIVAQKIIKFANEKNNIVVVVSAQGKTTDRLIKEAQELSLLPNEREMDMLLSTGEQISAAKLAILLNRLNYKAISLTGWQSQIITNTDYQKAKILCIDTKRIKNELENKKIVIITGFQGINKNLDITTLGRGGSDTTAVAIATALKAKHCYIFSDVDGIYTADPREVKTASKLKNISYQEMSCASEEGAKVLHGRCVELAQKYDMPIIAASTFNENDGTEISNESNNKMEESLIKSIVQNNNILIAKITNQKNHILNLNKEAIDIQNNLENKNFDISRNDENNLSYHNSENINNDDLNYNNSKGTINKDILNYSNSKKIYNIINLITKNKIRIGNYFQNVNFSYFTINREDRAKIENLFENTNIEYNISNVSKISIIGSGISESYDILNKILDLISDVSTHIIDIDVSAYKISILFDNIIDDNYLRKLHDTLI